jgi:MHS family proline/betaine transporter-like MFS transporter
MSSASNRWTKDSIKAIVVGSFATLFEWYDYALYGYFAPVIAKLFFPSEDSYLSLLMTFAVFAIGFVVRPLGAIFFGYLGDRIGRRYALSISVILMAIPTAFIGILPTYNDVGALAPVLLIVIRLIQGLAVGGNYGGAFVFVIEHAPANKKCLAGSCLMVGTIGGILVGSAIATLFSWLLSADALSEWGWRIPFLLGLLATFAGLYMRKKVPETPEFKAQSDMDDLPKVPAIEIFKNHKKRLFTAIMSILPDVIGIYVMFFFMTTYLTEMAGWEMNAALTVNTINLCLMVAIIPFFGWLSDIIKPIIVMRWVAISFILFAIPCFMVLSDQPSILAILAQTVFAISIGAYYGSMPAAIVGYFPTELRYSASALSFNLAAAIFGGTSPWVCTWLIKYTGVIISPAFYLVITGVITSIALIRMSSSKDYSNI